MPENFVYFEGPDSEGSPDDLSEVDEIHQQLNELMDMFFEGALEDERWNTWGSERAEGSIYELTRSVTEHVHGQGYEQIILSDRSARPFHAGLRAYWEMAYPEETPPSIFFLNPEGFQDNQNEEDLEAKFEKEHPYLFADRERSTFVFDVCIHSGETLERIQKGLGASGFNNAKYGVAVDARDEEALERIRLDYAFTNEEERRITTCYPFGSEEHITKLDQMLHSRLVNPNEKSQALQSLMIGKKMIEMVARSKFPFDDEARTDFMTDRLYDLFPKELVTSYSRVLTGDSQSFRDDRSNAKDVRDWLKRVVRERYANDHPEILDIQPES